MAQIIDETIQAELIKGKVSTTGGTYSVTLSALLDNANTIHVGNGTNQRTPLDAGDAMDVPGDALGDIYLRGTPPGWGVTDVVQGSKEFKFLFDQTLRIPLEFFGLMSRGSEADLISRLSRKHNIYD